MSLTKEYFFNEINRKDDDIEYQEWLYHIQREQEKIQQIQESINKHLKKIDNGRKEK